VLFSLAESAIDMKYLFKASAILFWFFIILLLISVRMSPTNGSASVGITVSTFAE
jgi:hypothetical protein